MVLSGDVQAQSGLGDVKGAHHQLARGVDDFDVVLVRA